MTMKSSKLTEGEQQEKGDILSRWSMIYQSLSARILEDRNKRAGWETAAPAPFVTAMGKKSLCKLYSMAHF